MLVTRNYERRSQRSQQNRFGSCWWQRKPSVVGKGSGNLSDKDRSKPEGTERKRAAERMLQTENQPASTDLRMATVTEQWSGGDRYPFTQIPSESGEWSLKEECPTCSFGEKPSFT